MSTLRSCKKRGVLCFYVVKKQPKSNIKKMKKLNLLSNAEMKKIMGGDLEPPKECGYDLCFFEETPGNNVGGYCMQSSNGKQCRCVKHDGTSSVPLAACLPG